MYSRRKFYQAARLDRSLHMVIGAIEGSKILWTSSQIPFCMILVDKIRFKSLSMKIK